MSDGVHRRRERAPRRTALRRFRLDFTFDDEAFELKSGEEDIGENVVVGGANRWAYNTFVNYETFPKGWDVPILVYFKETQTPESQWGVGPGEMATSAEAIANGAVSVSAPSSRDRNAKQSRRVRAAGCEVRRRRGSQ